MPTIHGGQVYGAARAVGLSHGAAITATAIAKGESGWNTDAHNPVGRDDSWGLWQINRKAHGDRFGTGEQLTDIMVNARAMASLSAGGSTWQPWTVYTSGKYRQYMDDAREAADAVLLKPNTPAGWEDVARTGAGIKKSASITNLPHIIGGVASDPIGAGGDLLGAVNPLDNLAGAAGVVLAALASPDWWRRVGVGALGGFLLVAALVWLGRDLITDTAASAIGKAVKT